MSDLVAELRADAVRIGKKQGIDKELLSLWRAADRIEALEAGTATSNARPGAWSAGPTTPSAPTRLNHPTS